jgi:hypothetical protein
VDVVVVPAVPGRLRAATGRRSHGPLMLMLMLMMLLRLSLIQRSQKRLVRLLLQREHLLQHRDAL